MEGNIVTIRFLITISDLQVKQITIQEDHNIHMYLLFCLVVLEVKNLRMPLLLLMHRNQVLEKIIKNETFMHDMNHRNES